MNIALALLENLHYWPILTSIGACSFLALVLLLITRDMGAA